MQLAPNQVASIEKLVEDAHELADAVNDLVSENPALAVMLLATLTAYLEHIQQRINTMIGVSV